MTEKERQKAIDHIIKYGGEGYDDPLDNYPLTPEIRAKREQRRKEAEERGYPMTREEVRAAVLADMEESERHFNTPTC